MCRTGLLGSQKIHGYDHAHQQISQKAHNAEYAAEYTAVYDSHQRCCLRQQILGHPVFQRLIIVFQLSHHPPLQRRICLQQFLNPSTDGIVVVFNIGNQLQYTFIQFGNQYQQQQIQQHTDQRPSQQDTNRPCPLGKPPLLRFLG